MANNGAAPRPAGESHVVVASNRGPVAFVANEEGLTLQRGAGGLVTGLLSVAAHHPLEWVCAALSDADRLAARAAPRGRLHEVGHDTGGAAVRMLDIDPLTFTRAYSAVANRVLWFVNHLLYATPIQPVFDATFWREWGAYVDYDDAFAVALDEEAPPGSRVLVHDYHLFLTPARLRARRPDLRIAHFTHTPWAPPDYFALLPDSVARDVLLGVLGADWAGFQSARWADAFLDCCERWLGADVDIDRASRIVRLDGRACEVAICPLGVDAGELAERASQPDVEARLATLRETVGTRAVIVRIDRTEPSKNIVRGIRAYGELLREHPEWHERLVHLVFAYPSRHDLPEYREYTGAVQRVAAAVNDEFGRPGWQPVHLEVSDDYARSLAALRLADVLVVNPLRDGMNLVAKEGPVLAEAVALVLSREAGAVAELGADSFVVNPYDVRATAAAMHSALLLPRAERLARAERLREAAGAMPPRSWFTAQLRALDALPDAPPERAPEPTPEPTPVTRA